MVVSFLGLGIILWFVLAPVQLGGQVSYVIITGNSMEPRFSHGDLVIVRQGENYRVGDAVLYQHSGYGFVFHRIIERDGNRFILQGDNNTWIDSYMPTAEDIFGKYWVQIPKVGKIIALVRTPRYLTLFSLGMGFFLIAPHFNDPKERKNKQKVKMKKNIPSGNISSAGNVEGIIVLGLVLLGALLLGFFAFTRPLERFVDDNLEYQHVGVLVYHAPDSQDIYDTDVIQTGEPIFLQLTCDVQLFFSYQITFSQFEGILSDQISGNYRVTAQISDPNGWNRSIELMPRTEYTGSGFTAGMDLDLCQINNMIMQMEEKTGTHNNWYDLNIYPEVSVIGDVIGRPLEDSFFPQFRFQVDEHLMRLSRELEGTGLEHLTVIRSGAIPGMRLAQNVLRAFGLEIPVTAARWISSVLFVFSLLGIILVGLPLYQTWRRGFASRIRVQYDPLLIDVQPGSLSSGKQAIMVDTFKDLAKLAERYGAMILSESNGKSNKYCVRDGETMYVYALDTRDIGLALSQGNSLRQTLVKAQETEEFQLYYQPIVSTDNNQMIAAEALLRWFHPEKGLIYPAEFISIAEENGLMHLIDNWVIKKACQQLKTWADEDILPIVISVNVSPHRFIQENFVDWLSETILETDCDPRYLQL
ncbi:MAG: signal peptidase I, partial [Chloroflexi bacterium]|nr:signal peptidase I [Chloroflexota bacterium]